MSSATPARPNLLPVAAFVSLLVIVLAATGLFALHLTNQKTSADLVRLDALENTLHLTVRTRAAFKTQVQEWKNILLRGRDPKDLATYRAGFEKQEILVRDGLAAIARDTKLENIALPARTLDLVAEHIRLGEAYRSALSTFDAAQSDAPFQADAAVRGLDRPLSDRLDALAVGFETAATQELAALSARAAARYEALRRITWIVASLAVLASLWLCFRATRLA